MKPKKNRVFCRACNRPKMLFESQAKADNFIKFNRDEIQSCSGKTPERSYYCAFCGGWHVTSCKSAVIGSHIDERDQNIIEKLETKRNGKEEMIKVSVDIAQKIGTSKVMVYFGELDNCVKIVEECRELLESMRDYCDVLPKYFELRGKIEKYEKDINYIRQVFAMSLDEREHILGIEDPTKEETALQEMIKGVQLVDVFNTVKNGIEEKIEDGEYELAGEIIASFEKDECKMEKNSPYNGIKNEIIRSLSVLVKKINVCVDRQRRIEKNELVQEEKKRKEKISDENRRTMLEILQRMETAKVAIENEETGKCEDEIEVIYYLLEQLPTKDDNYMILKAHADFLSAEAGKMSRSVAA